MIERFQRLLGLFFLASLCLCLAASRTHAAATANPAVISGVTATGVGYVTYQQGQNGLTAQVGRWDSPYSGHDPSLEPYGESALRVNVDVRDGGIASFDYQLKTYDAGIYDWLDIYLETPGGTYDLESHLGKPGSDYGTFWISPRISLSQDLSRWRNQQVTFVFSVAQDGWGDQTSTDISNFAIRSCRTAPLTELTDPDALSFEAGNTVDTGHLSEGMQTAVSCFAQAVGNAGGVFRINSAYRPPQYQAHLREVYDKWQTLRLNDDPECQALRSQVEAEFNRHGLLLSQRPASPSGPHTLGDAADISINPAITGLPTSTMLSLASDCGLYRRLPVADPIHFELSATAPAAQVQPAKPLRPQPARVRIQDIGPPPVSVQVEVQDLPNGTARYRYSLTNNSDQDVVSLSIGYDHHQGVPELEAAPVDWYPDTGIPATSVEGPAGWPATVVTTEEIPFLSIDWLASDSTVSIRPNTRVEAFAVLLDAEHDEFASSHWTAILADGQAISAPITLLEIPAAPDTLESTALSATQIQLTWMDASDNESGFRIERSVDGVNFVERGTAPVNAGEFIDTQCLPSTTYTYRVRATNGAGDSLYSNTTTSTTPVGHLITVTAPNGGETWAGGAPHLVTWSSQDVSGNVEIQLSLDSGDTWSSLVSPTANDGSQSVSLPATPSTHARIRVRALDNSADDASDADFTVTYAGGTLSAPRQVSFGTVRLGRTKRKTVVLKNTSRTASLLVNVAVPGAPFTLISGGGTSTIRAKGTLKVVVQCQPTTAGPLSGALSLQSSDPNRMEASIPLQGTAR